MDFGGVLRREPLQIPEMAIASAQNVVFAVVEPRTGGRRAGRDDLTNPSREQRLVAWDCEFMGFAPGDKVLDTAFHRCLGRIASRRAAIQKNRNAGLAALPN